VSTRAVVTGLGVAAPSGLGADEHFKTVFTGENRLGPITLFDPSPYLTRIAGEVADFSAEGHVESRIAVQTDRWTWLAFAAARQALDDARLDPAEHDPYTLAVAMASSSGGNLFGQRELQRLWGQPDRTVGAYQSIAWFYAATVGQLSIHHGIKGPSVVLATEGAGGLDSIGHAVRLVRRGTSAVLAGGTECPLSPYALACQERSGWLSTKTDPDTAYAPFDVDATGYVPAEGGAVLLVEDLEAANRRGVPTVFAEVLGWAATYDGEPAKRGSGGSVAQYARAMRLALDRAGVAPDDVDVVFPDALAVPEYDAAEAAALRAVFGTDGPVAVTTQKSLLGRSYQGSSALDAATAVLAIHHGALPASASPRRPAPGCELNFVTESGAAKVDVALVLARGFDGFNTALVLGRYGPEDSDGSNGNGRQRPGQEDA
jgi:minimal PKS chain-length factor (CLF/KS beta)